MNKAKLGFLFSCICAITLLRKMVNVDRKSLKSYTVFFFIIQFIFSKIV